MLGTDIGTDISLGCGVRASLILFLKICSQCVFSEFQGPWWPSG